MLRPLLLALVVGLLGGSEAAYETCDWSFRKNPKDCSSYFQCNHGTALLRECSGGLHWNALHNTCDWPNRANCLLEDGDIVLAVENELDREEICDNSTPFVPHSSDCGKYYVCDHGTLVEMSCSPPLHWNPTMNGCDWPHNAGCGSGNKPVAPGVAGTTVSPPAPPPESIEVEGETTTRPVPIRPTTTTTKRPVTSQPSPPDSTIFPILVPGGSDTDTSVGPPAPPPFDFSSPISSDNKYKVICYFTGWSVYRPVGGKFTPDDVDPTLCTHIVYAFATLDSSSWTIKIADSWMDIDNHFYEKVTAFKKDGIKVTMAFGGWNDSEGQKYSLLLRDPVKQSSFINSVVAFIKKYNFDGVDLDYEYPACPQGKCDPRFNSDKNGFAALVQGLRAALPKGSIISAAVSCNKNIIDQGYDVSTLSEYLDWIGIMDYDIHGAWEKETGHIAPLYSTPADAVPFLNVDYSISHWISKGASPSKLIMGIPLYGQSFTLANPSQRTGLRAPITGPGTAGTYTRQAGILSFYEICSANLTNVVQDPEGRMGPYAYDKNQWVSYDDVEMIGKKSEYIIQKGLGGAMVWALDFDDFKNVCGKGKYPLLKSLKNALAPIVPPRRRPAKLSRFNYPPFNLLPEYFY